MVARRHKTIAVAKAIAKALTEHRQNNDDIAHKTIEKYKIGFTNYVELNVIYDLNMQHKFLW